MLDCCVRTYNFFCLVCSNQEMLTAWSVEATSTKKCTRIYVFISLRHHIFFTILSLPQISTSRRLLHRHKADRQIIQIIVLGINFQLVSRAMLCLHKYHTVRETAGCQHTRTAAYVYRKNNIQIKKCWDQRHRLFLLHLLKAYFYVFLFDKRTMSYGHWCIEVRHWWLLSKTLFLVRRLQVSRREIFFLFSLARIILLISSAIGSLLLWHYISAHASNLFDSMQSTEEL